MNDDSAESRTGIEDLWRVYLPEWVIVHTITGRAPQEKDALFAQAWAAFEQQYAGRVLDEDVQVVEDPLSIPERLCVRLKLRLPVLKGEFKHRSTAHAHLRADYRLDTGAAVLVQRNSREDHELRNYGVKKLADPDPLEQP